MPALAYVCADVVDAPANVAPSPYDHRSEAGPETFCMETLNKVGEPTIAPDAVRLTDKAPGPGGGSGVGRGVVTGEASCTDTSDLDSTVPTRATTITPPAGAVSVVAAIPLSLVSTGV